MRKNGEGFNIPVIPKLKKGGFMGNSLFCCDYIPEVGEYIQPIKQTEKTVNSTIKEYLSKKGLL